MTHASARQVTCYAMLDTPVGPLLIGGDGSDVLLIGFSGGSRAVAPERDWRRDDSLYPQARAQIAEYFAGGRTRFDFPVRMVGTPFQRAVWQALLDVPYGSTAAYRDLAACRRRRARRQADAACPRTAVRGVTGRTSNRRAATCGARDGRDEGPCRFTTE